MRFYFGVTRPVCLLTLVLMSAFPANLHADEFQEFLQGKGWKMEDFTSYLGPDKSSDCRQIDRDDSRGLGFCLFSFKFASDGNIRSHCSSEKSDKELTSHWSVMSEARMDILIIETWKMKTYYRVLWKKSVDAIRLYELSPNKVGTRCAFDIIRDGT